jgi:hypothetical protein
VDARGFIHSLEVIEAAPQSQGTVSNRDERITRLAVLKVAAAFGAARPECKSSDVLAIAERWLAWINQ